MDEQQEYKMVEAGLAWAKAAVEIYGFVHTLGLLRFIAIAVERDMDDDIANFVDEKEKQQ